MNPITPQQIRALLDELNLAYVCHEPAAITEKQINILETIADRAEDVAALINKVPRIP